MQDLQNSDCIVVEGSNFAEAHPVGFQWVMEARARGATLIHVDPRFSRTSALAIRLCDGTSCGHAGHDEAGNIADVTLAPGVTVASGARRGFLTTSACGVCGKASIQDICVLPQAAVAADQARFAPARLAALQGTHQRPDP